MHRLSRLAVLFAGLVWSAAVHAVPVLSDDYATREWHMSDGLPNEQIARVIQDPTGYLWITPISATAQIVRFDGAHFEEYTVATDGPAFSRVTAASSTVGLVVAPAFPKRGLMVLRDRTFQPWQTEAFGDRLVTAMFAERDGTLWIACDDGTVVRHVAGKNTRFDEADGVPRVRFRWFASDAGGQVWLVSDGSVVCYSDGKFTALKTDLEGELRIGSSTRGGPWLVTRDRLLRIEDERLVEVAKLPSLLGAHYVQAIEEDRNGTLWLGTRSQGLHVLEGGALEQVPTSHEDIFSLCEDRDGNMWAGTNGGGLNRIRRKIYRLYDKAAGLLDNQTHTIAADANGDVWFANRDGGAARLHDGAIDLYAQHAGWPRLSLVSIFPLSAGEMGMTTATGTYTFAKQDPVNVRRLPGLPQMPQVRVTYVTRNGDVWMSVDPERVGRWREGKFETFGRAEGMDGRQVRGITEDATGRIWLGAAEGKLFRSNGAHFEPVPLGGLTPGAIQAIRVEDDGTVWLGTVSGGIVVLRNGQVHSCTARQGLPDSNVTQILADSRGSLWFGSKRGVFRLNRQEILDCLDGKIARVTPLVIGQDEGLKDISCQGIFQPAAAQSRDGKLWFATRRGVLSIDPTVPLAPPVPPPVTIEEVRFDDQRVALKRPFTVASGVRKLEIRFGVLNLSAPDRVHARYRLDGFDDDWVTALPSRVASYPRLPPGDYKFRVMATGGDGAVNEKGDTLDFTVEPQWWQTWWCRLGAILLATVVVALIVRALMHRRWQAKLGALERERAIEQERRRIAQNIHDDLGASLTRISLLTQHARHENTSGAPYYDQIHTTAVDITRSMDEIVWAVNPKYDHLESLAGYIGDFAQNFLRVAGIRCRLDIPPEMPHVPLTSQTRHHLFLCCKEALNNVVKHAGADEVVVAIHSAAQEFVIVIKDNGGGYHPTPGRHGVGLAEVGSVNGMGVESIRRRMTGIGGTFEIAAGEEGGTVVTLTMLFARDTS